MVKSRTIGDRLRRIRFAGDKVRWGFKVVGIRATLRGAGRLGYLFLRRPGRSEVKLRSGPVLEFGPERVALSDVFREATR